MRAVDSREARALLRAERADVAAAELFKRLQAGGIEALLVRGPAIARRLYADGERGYGDCDVLVSDAELSSFQEVLRTMEYSPFTSLGRAQHWHRPLNGDQIDVHRSLWGVRAGASVLWRALSAPPATLELHGIEVRVPDLAGTALVIALHSSQHGSLVAHPRVDLERALSAFDDDVWGTAVSLATQTLSLQAFRQGLSSLPAGRSRLALLGLDPASSPQSALRSRGIRVPDYLFEGLPVADRISIVRKRFVPSREEMATLVDPTAARSRVRLAVAHARRLGRVPRRMHRLASDWRELRKEAQPATRASRR